MAKYCNELEVWDELDLTEETTESFSSVSSGDQLELSGKFLIASAMTSSEYEELSSDQDVIVYEGNDDTASVASTSDYTVDKRDGEVIYNGSSSNVTVKYKTAPKPNSWTDRKIKEMSGKIDRKTNTTFNGQSTVTDEVYDGTGRGNEFYPFKHRPVRSISKVEVNEADPGDSDDWKTRTQGRPDDFILRSELGIEFVDSQAAPSDHVANLRVTYDYGYSDIPDEIRRLCALLVVQEAVKAKVSGAVSEGLDDFDPRTTEEFKSEIQELFSRWTFTPALGPDIRLASEGTIS